MKLIILSDDRARDKRFVAKHSFSILIRIGFESYLVGLGVDPDTLEHNAREAGVDFGVIDKVVVTHEHTPHFGGYKFLADEAPFTEVYIPFGSSESLGRLLSRNGLRPIEVIKTLKIGEEIYITQPYYGPPYEHIVLINDKDGLVAITGCLHPGLTPLLEVKRIFGKKIKGIIGGFHLYNTPTHIIDQYIDTLIRNIQPEFLVPLHCSGAVFVDRLRRRTEIRLIELSTGDELEID